MWNSQEKAEKKSELFLECSILFKTLLRELWYEYLLNKTHFSHEKNEPRVVIEVYWVLFEMCAHNSHTTLLRELLDVLLFSITVFSKRKERRVFCFSALCPFDVGADNSHTTLLRELLDVWLLNINCLFIREKESVVFDRSVRSPFWNGGG